MSDSNTDGSYRNLVAKSSVTDVGSYTVKGERTSYVEFRLDQPNGMHKVCYCNQCGLEFYVAPFGFAGECPCCHSDRVAWREEVGRSLHG